MDVKSGFQQTEVGVIPKDWDALQLKDISTKITDGEHVTPKRTGYGYHLLSARNVLNGKIDLSDVDYVGADEYRRIRQRCAPEPGDVLISCSGSIGRIAVVPRGLECVLVRSAALAKLDRTTADSFFIQYWLQANHAQSQISNSVNQGAQPNLFLNHIERLQCPIPPLTEQRAIAEALCDADTLVESLEHLITKKRRLKQGAMQELLTGRKRLPGFSGKWESKPFDRVLSRLNAKIHQIQTSDYQASGLYPVVDQGKYLVVGFSDRHDRRFQCPPGGVIVFGDHTCIVKFVDFDFLVGADGTQVLQAETGQCTRFHAFQLQHKGISPTGYNRHFKFLKEREFMAPPLPEQVAIADVLSDMDVEIAAVEAKLAKARHIKQGMMQELLIGRIRLL